MSLDKTCAVACKAAIEDLPHLAEKMCQLWRSSDLDDFVHGVLLDSREGKRRGLPPEVAQEMVFVARLNNMVRAMDASPLVPVTVDAAGQIVVAEGAAKRDAADVGAIPWPAFESRDERRGRGNAVQPAVSPVNRQPTARQAGAAPLAWAPAGAATKGRTHHYLSLFLNETPPMPSRVRLDLTRPAQPGGGNGPDAMGWEFFRCITNEMAGLGVEELALSHHGRPERCAWLGEAVRLVKQQGSFHQVSLHVDLLVASEVQMAEAIAHGLDSLVVECNLQSAAWRTQAFERLAEDSHYLYLRVSRLLQKRDEHFARSGHRCVIKLAETGQSSMPALANAIGELADMVDAYSVEWLPDSDGPAEAMADGCLCWTPFVEANVRVDGHLAVCTHDQKGFSYVADLKQTEFSQAWHSPMFRHTRRELMAGNARGGLCSNCPRASCPA